jgi:hypothetical protein
LELALHFNYAPWRRIYASFFAEEFQCSPYGRPERPPQAGGLPLRGKAAVNFEVFRLVEQVAVQHPGSQLAIRKFEAILLGLPGLVLRLLQVMDLRGGLESFLASFGALPLKLLQFGFRLREGAVEALFIQAEAGEEIGTVVQSLGLGQDTVDFGVGGQSAGVFLNAQREEIIFHGADAVETPKSVGDGLNGSGFEQSLRGELGEDLGAGVLIRDQIVSGQNDGLAGEGVAESIEHDSPFAFGCDGSSGVGGVLTVDRGATGIRRGLSLVHGNAFT